ncbi:putative TMhelix containing protein [Vibrio phage 199E37-1]|nr:putative TMhelix containing protein [Vibrio phage 199E37-1]
MAKYKWVLDWVQTLFPIVFPKNEFKPKRAAFVFVMVIVMMFAHDYFGAATIENAIELTGSVVELTEE